MGQQVSRSLTRTLPVLFWTKRLPLIGCQSPQPFSFHLTALLWPPASPSSQMIWTNTVGCLFVAHWLYLSTSSCTVPFSTLCQTFVFKLEKKIYIYISRHGFYPPSSLCQWELLMGFSCPCVTDWNSLQCHFHPRPDPSVLGHNHKPTVRSWGQLTEDRSLCVLLCLSCVSGSVSNEVNGISDICIQWAALVMITDSSILFSSEPACVICWTW